MHRYDVEILQIWNNLPDYFSIIETFVKVIVELKISN